MLFPYEIENIVVKWGYVILDKSRNPYLCRATGQGKHKFVVQLGKEVKKVKPQKQGTLYF